MCPTAMPYNLKEISLAHTVFRWFKKSQIMLWTSAQLPSSNAFVFIYEIKCDTILNVCWCRSLHCTFKYVSLQLKKRCCSFFQAQAYFYCPISKDGSRATGSRAGLFICSPGVATDREHCKVFGRPWYCPICVRTLQSLWHDRHWEAFLFGLRMFE